MQTTWLEAIFLPQLIPILLCQGVEAAINFKSEDIGARLSELCPNGIDVFFDNVGGALLNEVLARINIKARIVLCGSILRSYPSEPGPANYFNLTRQSVDAWMDSPGLSQIAFRLWDFV